MVAAVIGTWRIDSRPSIHSEWKPQPYYDQMLREDALDIVEWLAGRYDLARYRLVDDSTGEIVHLGRDGKPLPVEPTVMRRDTRTPEQVQADLAADRYEASLESDR